MKHTATVMLALAAFLAAGSATSYAGELPSPVVLASDPHQVTTQQVTSALLALGYADVGAVDRDGRIFQTTASWRGESHQLRIDANSGSVTDAAAAAAAADPALPSPITIAVDADEATARNIADALARIGYDKVRDIGRDGQVFRARADFQGTSYDLRITAENGRVTAASQDQASGNGVPAALVIASDANDASVTTITRALAAAGFSNIRGVQKDGRIFDAVATWQGSELNLRVDARSGSVSVL